MRDLLPINYSTVDLDYYNLRYQPPNHFWKRQNIETRFEEESLKTNPCAILLELLHVRSVSLKVSLHIESL